MHFETVITMYSSYIKIIIRIIPIVIFSKFNNICNLVGYTVTNETGRIE
jgi:hypothetical protein